MISLNLGGAIHYSDYKNKEKYYQDILTNVDG